LLNRVLLPAVIVIIAISLFIALKQSKPEKAVMHKTEKVWRVNTVSVVFEDLSPELTLYGRVETPRQASLNAALEADVLEVNILEGTEVDAEQVLVVLDGTDVQLLIEQRQADLDEINVSITSELARYQRDKALLENETELLSLADKAVARAKALEQNRLVSKTVMDDASTIQQRQMVTLKRLQHDIAEHPARLAGLRAKQRRASALLEQAQVDLERSVIKSPFAGRIAKLDVGVGDRVQSGTQIVSIYDLENLEVRAQLPGRYIKQIQTSLKLGEHLTAQSNHDGKPLDFSLSRLSGEVRPDTGGVDGLFRLITDGQTLALGEFVELSLKLGQQSSVIAIPYSALYGLDKVYRLNNDHLQAIQVERVGEYVTDNGKISLLVRSNELQQGDQIISTQVPNAMTGLRVEALSD